MIQIADLLTIITALLVGGVFGATGMAAIARARLQRPDEQQVIYMRGYLDCLDQADRAGDLR